MIKKNKKLKNKKKKKITSECIFLFGGMVVS
jgi:hypothetical protein